MKVYSFSHGGISFDDPTVPPRDSSVTAFLPGLCVYPLVDASMNQIIPAVSVGENVREGMLIGRSRTGAASIHASAPGRITKIVSLRTVNGQMVDAFVIRLEGSFEKLGKPEETYPWDGMHPYDLQRLIAEHGVVEMEGAGKPVSEIITSLRNAPDPITLVVRCVFDDPWLAADYTLCRERTRAVVEGCRIISRIIRASKIIYAVSFKEKELGEKFIKESGNWTPPSFLVLTGSKYPQSNRRELESVLRNYGKKEEIDLGSIMILGPATLAAVQDAVKLRKPVLERYIAVGGSAVRRPQVMKVRIGTRISQVFAECGGLTGHPGSIAIGSPLSGKTVADLDEPITQTSYALSAFLEKPKTSQHQVFCISCGECRNVCPVGLDPDEIYKGTRASVKSTARGSFDKELRQKACECHGCGCCDVVCPSRLPLSSIIAASASGVN